MAFGLFIVLFAIEYLGLGYDFPILRALKVSLVLSFGLAGWLALKGEPGRMFRYRQARLILTFVLLTGASMTWALVGTHALRSFQNQVGYFVMCFAGFMLLTTEARFRRFLHVLVAFHVLLVLINMDILLSGARVGVFKAGFFLGDGNDFGWSLNVALPFALFGAFTDSRFVVRVLSFASAGLLAFGIVGTQSRGATIALAASGLWFILNSKRKALSLALLTVALATALLFAPAKYFERMDTVASFQEDNSAQGRLRAWRAATQMAFDYPLGVGAGNFNSAYGRFYRGNIDPKVWGAARWISVHSIYFAVLAEYGFLGLFLWLFILWSIFRDNLRLERLASIAGSGAIHLPGVGVFLNMGLIGYAAGGAFLGGVDYPHLVILSFLSLGALSMREAEVRQAAATGTDPGPPSTDGPPGRRAAAVVHGKLGPRPVGRARGALGR